MRVGYRTCCGLLLQLPVGIVQLRCASCVWDWPCATACVLCSQLQSPVHHRGAGPDAPLLPRHMQVVVLACNLVPLIAAKPPLALSCTACATQDLPPRNHTAGEPEEDEGVLPTGEVQGADAQAVAVIGRWACGHGAWGMGGAGARGRGCVTHRGGARRRGAGRGRHRLRGGLVEALVCQTALVTYCCRSARQRHGFV